MGLLLPAWDQGALSALTKRKRRAALRKLQDARAAASTLAVRGKKSGMERQDWSRDASSRLQKMKGREREGSNATDTEVTRPDLPWHIKT